MSAQANPSKLSAVVVLAGLPVAVMLVCFCLFIAGLNIYSRAPLHFDGGFGTWLSFLAGGAALCALAMRAWWRSRRGEETVLGPTARLVPALLGVGLLGGGAFVGMALSKGLKRIDAYAVEYCSANAARLGLDESQCRARARGCLSRSPPGQPMHPDALTACLQAQPEANR